MASERQWLSRAPGGASGEETAPVQAPGGGGLKLQLLASLNHEIRTPLSGVLGAIDLLFETPLNEEQKEYARMARDSASGLLALLNETLEYQTLAAGCTQLDEAEFDLRDTLQAVLAEMTVRARERSLEIRWLMDAGMPGTVVGDDFRVRQLAQLLIQFVVRTCAAGPVLVETKMEARAGLGPGAASFTLSVEPAQGLPPARIGELLEDFESSANGSAARFQSAVLDLALARRVVELLHGELAIDAPAEAGRLLACVPLRLTGLTGSSGAGLDSAGSARRILVVEDNPVSQRVLRAVLAKGEFHVECAGDGPSALELAARQTFGLVLMDLFMPGMDGLETLARLRRVPGYEHTPVLALTAEVSDQVRVLCRQSGMAAFLNKPVQAAELLTTVRRCLASG